MILTRLSGLLKPTFHTIDAIHTISQVLRFQIALQPHRVRTDLSRNTGGITPEFLALANHARVVLSSLTPGFNSVDLELRTPSPLAVSTVSSAGLDDSLLLTPYPSDLRPGNFRFGTNLLGRATASSDLVLTLIQPRPIPRGFSTPDPFCLL